MPKEASPMRRRKTLEMHEMTIAKKVIVQMVWGDNIIEYETTVIGVDEDGAYVKPFIHNGKPLELNIQLQSHVVCNAFTDDEHERRRVGWRNIGLETVQQGDRIIYYLSTSQFNRIAGEEERRDNERTVVNKTGSLLDKNHSKYKEIRIYDVSDNGISFYVANEFFSDGEIHEIYFTDYVNGQLFEMKLKSKIVRRIFKAGLSFYGCEVVESNRDFLFYTNTLKMEKKRRID